MIVALVRVMLLEVAMMVVIVVGVRRDGDLLMVRYARRQMDRRRGRGGRRRRSFTLLAFDAIVIDDDVVAAYSRRGTLLNRRCRSSTGSSFGSCILGYGTHRACDRTYFSFTDRIHRGLIDIYSSTISIRLSLIPIAHVCTRVRLAARAEKHVRPRDLRDPVRLLRNTRTNSTEEEQEEEAEEVCRKLPRKLDKTRESKLDGKRKTKKKRKTKSLT